MKHSIAEKCVIGLKSQVLPQIKVVQVTEEEFTRKFQVIGAG